MVGNSDTSDTQEIHGALQMKVCGKWFHPSILSPMLHCRASSLVSPQSKAIRTVLTQEKGSKFPEESSAFKQGEKTTTLISLQLYQKWWYKLQQIPGKLDTINLE